MQELNPYFGAACLLAAIGAWITNAWEAAAALAIVGVAFLLYGRDLRPWEQIPRWKRITVTTMIFIGGAFLVIYVISLGGFERHSAVSKRIVTGPSFVSSTRISAPKRPP